MMSAISARLSPAPAAGPLTAATIGASMLRNRRIASLRGTSNPLIKSLFCSCVPVMLATSPPAIKALPDPVSTIQRNSGWLRSVLTAARNASAMGMLIALSTSGRLNVRVATPVWASNSEIKGLVVIVLDSVAKPVRKFMEQTALVFVMKLGYFKLAQEDNLTLT